MGKKFYYDLAERAGWTFVQAFAMAFTVDAGSDDLSVSFTTKLVMASVAGLYAVLKGIAASKVGASNSASTLPAHLDPPAGTHVAS